MLALKNQAWLDLQKVQRHRRFCAPQHNAVDQITDAVHGVAGAVNVDLFDGFPAHEGRKHACQSKNMVQVTVGQEDMVQAFEANPRLQDLPLRAFATINHETELVMFNDKR